MDEDTKQNEVVFPEHLSELQGTDGTEIVIHDLDEDGNVIGWHKQPKGAN